MLLFYLYINLFFYSGAEYTSIDKIVTVCAALVNLGDGIVYNEKTSEQEEPGDC